MVSAAALSAPDAFCSPLAAITLMGKNVRRLVTGGNIYNNYVANILDQEKSIVNVVSKCKCN